MIHYQLRCDAEHVFDGWFRDSAAFDAQAASGLLSCPVCGMVKVTRALMAPALAKHQLRMQQSSAQEPGLGQVEVPTTAAATRAAPVKTAEPVAGGIVPDALRAMLQRMRTEVEKHCEYVGTAFAFEARRIHNGETATRGIYGDATAEEVERLADDGIEISSLPWVPRADG